jgi:hypothetical protein
MEQYAQGQWAEGSRMPETTNQSAAAEPPRWVTPQPLTETLGAIQDELIEEIGAAIDRVESIHDSDALREHFEVLRATLNAQVRAYLEHVVARRSTLAPHTSVMYAPGVGGAGVLATTFRGLIDAGALSVEQGVRLRNLANDRRTLLVFGDRRTGKSTLLNSLFEVIGVDERLVAIADGPDLPALRDRSFCVRLGIDDDTDLPALFDKAQRMNPSRLVIADLRAAQVRGFFTMLAGSPRLGGMGTLQAGTVEEALAAITNGLGGDVEYAHRLIAHVRPVFLHMCRNGGDQPRLAALWSVDGTADDELALSEIATPSPVGKGLLAEV